MFQVVEGRQSEDFNHFELYNLIEVEATDTRLMGVIAMRTTWQSKTNPNAYLYQIIHLDYSEYGVDDYFEYECLPESDECDYVVDDMNIKWEDFLAVMGGKVVKLPASIAVRLIDDAIDVWLDSELLKRGDDNEHFRHGALKRITFMKKSLIESGVISEGEAESLSEEECISTVVPKKLHTYETINYFIMRMVDHDLPAAAYLSSISKEELERSAMRGPEIQTLVRNSIKSKYDVTYQVSESGYIYYCKYISMGIEGYYYGSISLELTGGNMERNRKVSHIDVGFHKRLSTYESAMIVKRTEYITLYDMKDEIMNYFDIDRIPMMAGATAKTVGNGWLFMKYNPDNSHVRRAEYYLNGDVMGAALMTVAGEFVVLSYQLMNITLLEADIAASKYAPDMTLKGRYEVPNMVFQTMCETPGLMFNECIDHDEE